MSNVLSQEKKEQVIALGRLGWSLRRIEQATGVRRGNSRTIPEGCGDRSASTRRGGVNGHRQNRPMK